MANLDIVFHSLSDGTRRAVIAPLATGPASIGELARRHRMALPSFMKHKRKAVDAVVRHFPRAEVWCASKRHGDLSLNFDRLEGFAK